MIRKCTTFTLPTRGTLSLLLEQTDRSDSSTWEICSTVRSCTRLRSSDPFWNWHGIGKPLATIWSVSSKWSRITSLSWTSGKYVDNSRKPGVPFCKLRNHKDSVNAIAWAPQSAVHMCSVGDDCKAYIWDLGASKNADQTPLLEYKADEQITNLAWSGLQKEWLAICYMKQLQILRLWDLNRMISNFYQFSNYWCFLDLLSLIFLKLCFL